MELEKPLTFSFVCPRSQIPILASLVKILAGQGKTLQQRPLVGATVV